MPEAIPRCAEHLYSTLPKPQLRQELIRQPCAYRCCLNVLDCPNVRVSCGLAALPEEAESVSGQSQGQQQKRDAHNQLRKNHKKMHMEVQVQENRNCKSRIEFLQRLLVFKNQSEEKMRVVSPFSPVDRMTCCGGLLALCLFLCVSLLCVKVRSSSCRSP